MIPLGSILAIDTSGTACSAALWRSGGLAAHRYRDMARGHAEFLMPIIVETLADSGQLLRTVDAIAVTVGPGAFTGIRIGLAAARGIGLAAGIPVCGVTTFAAVAEAVPEVARRNRRTIVALDSKRGDLFVQSYDRSLLATTPPAVLTADHVAGLLSEAPSIVAGDGVALLRPLIRRGLADGSVQVHCEGPADARYVAALAARLLSAGEAPPPIPVYLRAPDVRVGSNSGAAPEENSG